jgi:hypothetical protein
MFMMYLLQGMSRNELYGNALTLIENALNTILILMKWRSCTFYLLNFCYRNVLILLFRKKEPNATLTKQEILATASSHLKREISDKEYHQVWIEITYCFLCCSFMLLNKFGTLIKAVGNYRWCYNAWYYHELGIPSLHRWRCSSKLFVLAVILVLVIYLTRVSLLMLV